MVGINKLRIHWHGNFFQALSVTNKANSNPPPPPKIIVEDNGSVRALQFFVEWYGDPAITLENKNPRLWRIIRRSGQHTKVVEVTYKKKVVEHHDERENIYLSHECTICTKPAAGVCSKCMITSYCGIQCQQKDWTKGHCQ